MPLASATDEDIFPFLNLVLIGYLTLIFIPHWQLTKLITLILPGIYGVLYFGLLQDYVQKSNIPLAEQMKSFNTLTGVIGLFKDPAVVMAGWTHYIAFDLLVARFIVYDAITEHIPHLFVIPLLPLTLMAGPVGLASYLLMKGCKQIGVGLLLYCIVTMLSIVMVFWIFILPASFRLGITEYGIADAHLKFMNNAFDSMSEQLAAPPSISLKYYKHTAVVLLHQVPAGIWALLIPFQLCTPFRKYMPAVHRSSGYLFLAMVPLIVAGIVLIYQRKLDFYHDFPVQLGKTGFSEWGLSPFPDSFFALEIAIYCACLYFVSTALRALYAAVIQRNYKVHRRWIIRHVASGIFVALQRVYIGARQTRYYA